MCKCYGSADWFFWLGVYCSESSSKSYPTVRTRVRLVLSIKDYRQIIRLNYNYKPFINNDVLVIIKMHVLWLISPPLSIWDFRLLNLFLLCSNYWWIRSYEVHVRCFDMHCCARVLYPVQPPLSVARWCGLAWRYRPEVTNLPTLSALKTYLTLILLSLKTCSKSSPWFCRWKGLRTNICW